MSQFQQPAAQEGLFNIGGGITVGIKKISSPNQSPSHSRNGAGMRRTRTQKENSFTDFFAKGSASKKNAMSKERLRDDQDIEVSNLQVRRSPQDCIKVIKYQKYQTSLKKKARKYTLAPKNLNLPQGNANSVQNISPRTVGGGFNQKRSPLSLCQERKIDDNFSPKKLNTSNLGRKTLQQPSRDLSQDGRRTVYQTKNINSEYSNPKFMKRGSVQYPGKVMASNLAYNQAKNSRKVYTAYQTPRGDHPRIRINNIQNKGGIINTTGSKNMLYRTFDETNSSINRSPSQMDFMEDDRTSVYLDNRSCIPDYPTNQAPSHNVSMSQQQGSLYTPFSNLVDKTDQLKQHWEGLIVQIETLKCHNTALQVELEMEEKQSKTNFEESFGKYINLVNRLISLMEMLVKGHMETHIKKEIETILENVMIHFNDFLKGIEERDLDSGVLSDLQKVALEIFQKAQPINHLITQVKEERVSLLKKINCHNSWLDMIPVQKSGLDETFEALKETKLNLTQKFEEIDIYLQGNPPSENLLGEVLDTNLDLTQLREMIQYSMNHLTIQEINKLSQSVDKSDKQIFQMVKTGQQELVQINEQIQRHRKSEGFCEMELFNLESLDLWEVLTYIIDSVPLRCQIQIFEALTSIKEMIEDDNNVTKEELSPVSKLLEVSKACGIQLFEIISGKLETLFTELCPLEISVLLLQNLMNLTRNSIQASLNFKIQHFIEEVVSEKIKIQEKTPTLQYEQCIQILRKTVTLSEERAGSSLISDTIKDLSESQAELRAHQDLEQSWWLFRFHLEILRKQELIYLKDLNNFYDQIQSSFSSQEGSIWGYFSDDEGSISIGNFLSQLTQLENTLGEVKNERVSDLNDHLEKLEEKRGVVEEREKEIAILSQEAQQLKEAIRVAELEKKEIINTADKKNGLDLDFQSTNEVRRLNFNINEDHHLLHPNDTSISQEAAGITSFHATRMNSINNTGRKVYPASSNNFNQLEINGGQAYIQNGRNISIQNMEVDNSLSHMGDHYNTQQEQWNRSMMMQQQQQQQLQGGQSTMHSEETLQEFEIKKMFSNFETRFIKDRFIRKLLTQLKLKGELGNNGFLWIKQAFEGIDIAVRYLDGEVNREEEVFEDPMDILEFQSLLEQDCDMAEFGFQSKKLTLDADSFNFLIWSVEDQENNENQQIYSSNFLEEMSYQVDQIFEAGSSIIDKQSRRVLAEKLGVIEHQQLPTEEESQIFQNIDFYSVVGYSCQGQRFQIIF